MRHVLERSGIFLILMSMLSLDVAGSWFSNTLSISEAEAFRRRHRRLDTDQEARSATQDAEKKNGEEAEEAQESFDGPRARRVDSGRVSEASPEEDPGSPEGTDDEHTAAPSGSRLPIGTIVHTLPADCEAMVVDNIRYSDCNGTVYRVAFQGSNLVYVVVERP